MNSETIFRIVTRRKNLVLLGETGSGKTELGLNLAILMARTGLAVHFFDLDQTKPLFRARELAPLLKKNGVALHYQEQDLDTPTVAAGIIEALMNPSQHVILDVGGGSHGSHMIGQFSHILNGDNTEIYYLVNPYRLWSGTEKDIRQTLQKVAGAAKLQNVSFVANPNLGADTSVEDVLTGLEKTCDLLPDSLPKFLCVEASLSEQLPSQLPLPCLPLTVYTQPDWI